MSATQITLTDVHLESELSRQRKELDKLQERLRGEERKLEAASTERDRLVDAVARGAAKEADVVRVKGQKEEIEIRIEGLRKLVAPMEATIRDLTEEFHRRQNAAAKAAREKAYAELQEDAASDANALVADLIAATEKLAAFDAKRIRLGTEFRDLGGAAAADRLAEMLFRNSGPQEKVRDPNTHNRVLEDRGWVFAGQPGPSFVRIPSAVNQFGNPLRLTVQSMRPRD